MNRLSTSWTGSEIENSTGGKWISGIPDKIKCTGVCYFVHQIKRGDLFILTNTEDWGSKYTDKSNEVQEIIKNGASAIITQNRLQNMPDDYPILLVDNTLKALWDLAKSARTRFQGKVICITGSVGKSTTKESLYHVLEKQGSAFRTRNNFNCQRGLPLSLAQTPENCQYGIFESSLSYYGRSLPKSQLVRPHVAIITDIQPDHLQFCTSLEEIADSKAKLFDALEPGGTAIINGENAFCARLKEHGKAVGVKNIIIYGEHPESTVKALDSRFNAYESSVKADINGTVVEYNLPIVGKHAVKNSLAVLAAVQAVGADVKQAAKDLESLKPLPRHNELENIPFKNSTYHLIDDTYSANPASIKAACEYASIVSKEFKSRIIVILGDMQELGKTSPKLHADLAPVLLNNNIQKAFLIGKDMHNLWVNLPKSMHGAYSKDAQELCDAIFKELKENDTILVKTSFRTHELVPILEALKNPNNYLKSNKAKKVNSDTKKPFKFVEVQNSDKNYCHLIFVGDTSPGENYQQRIAKNGGINILETQGYDYSLSIVSELLMQGDLVIANLETPLTNLEKSPFKDKKSYVHWSDTIKTPECLLKHKINIVSLANNHAYDYADAGFKQTLSILENNNIHFFGGGLNEKEADTPLIIKVNLDNNKTLHIALISAFTESKEYRENYNTYALDNKPGVASLNIKKIEQSITNLREFDPNIFVIIFPHWGGNYKWKSITQTKIANELIDIGADLIIGHGAHMIQEIEKLKEKWVIYSIGNFMFNSPGRYDMMNAPPYSFILSLNILSNNKFDVFLKLYPIITNNKLTNYQPRFLTQNEFGNFLETIAPRILIKDPTSSDICINKDKLGFYIELPVLNHQVKNISTPLSIEKKYWFDDIKSNTIFSLKEMETLSEIIFNSLINRQYTISSLPVELHKDTPQLVFLTISDNHSIGKTYFGSGSSLLETVNAILSKINEAKPVLDIQTLKLDIVQEVTILQNHDVKKPFAQDRSLYGMAFDRDLGLAYLPEVILTKTIINSDNLLQINAILKSSKLTASQKVAFSKFSTLNLFRFKLQSYVKSKAINAALYRGHRIYNEINTDTLLSAAISAGNYLRNAVQADGQFSYEYLPKKDENSTRYNVLRHAGSVYSMLELFELTKDEQLLKSIKLALSNLISRAKAIKINGQSYLCIVENDFAKLGANALTILSLSKYMSITNDTSHLLVAKKLARWMKHAQEDTGAFLIQKFRFSKKTNTNFVSNYYPGEAIFSLVRFYQVDPDERWLDIASNAANFIINVRDKNKKISQLEHDHWLLYGLNELYRIRPDPIYIEHTQKLCQAILRAQYTKDAPLDYKGSYYNPPRSTPAATRTEGLCAAYNLLNSLGYENECMKILEAIKLNMRFQLQTQYQPERTLYLINPQRALGGFSKSLTDYSIRIDYVQHNLSSIIALYNILKL